MNQSVIKKKSKNSIKRNESKPAEINFYINKENENLNNKLKAL